MHAVARRGRLAGIVALASAAVLASSSARADDPVAAEALFREGSALWQQGKIPAACERFTRSNDAEPGVGTLFFLADCGLRSGKRASAWYRLREAATLAARKGDTSRQALAERRSRELEPGLARLLVRSSPAGMPPHAVLRRDSVSADAASFDVPVPVDAGSHHLEVSAPGYRPWSTDVVVADAPGTVTVDVPHLKLAVLAPVATVSTPEAPPPPPAGTPRAWVASRIASGAVAVAGIGVGATFGVLAATGWSDVSSACPDHTCRSVSSQMVNAPKEATADTQANIATGALIVAGVAAAVFVATYLFSPARVGSSGGVPDTTVRF
jgi:hypothetical protein